MENLRGIVFVIIAMAMFSVEDAFIKSVSATLPVGQILLVLGAGGALVFATVARLSGQPLTGPQVTSPMLVLRSIAETLTALFFVLALWLAPLSVSGAILQATSLIVTVGAAVILREKVGWRRWSAISVGFIGVLVIIRPGLDGFQPAALFALASAVSLAARDLATRRIPAGTPSSAVSFWGFFSLLPAGIGLSLLLDPPVMPNAIEALRLLACIGFGTLGYYLIVSAMRMSDASALAPFRYARLLFSMILGAVFFAERPDFWTLIGAGIILTSGLYVIARERRSLESRVPQTG